MTRPSHVIHVDHGSPDDAPLGAYAAQRWVELHAEMVAAVVEQQLAETGGELTITDTTREGSLRLSDLHGCVVVHHSWIAENRTGEADAFAAGYLLGGGHRGEGAWGPADAWLQCPNPHGRVQPDARRPLRVVLGVGSGVGMSAPHLTRGKSDFPQVRALDPILCLWPGQNQILRRSYGAGSTRTVRHLRCDEVANTLRDILQSHLIGKHRHGHCVPSRVTCGARTVTRPSQMRSSYQSRRARGSRSASALPWSRTRTADQRRVQPVPAPSRSREKFRLRAR